QSAPSKRASHARHRFILRSGTKSFGLRLHFYRVCWIEYRNDEASLFAFKNNSYVWDAHWLGIDACMDIPENLSRKLAILLLRSNVPASVMRHDTLGNRSLIRNPTRLMAYQSASSL